MRKIDGIIIVIGLFLCLPLANASTFTVTKTEDYGEGSLRWAIEQANTEAELSTVNFDLPDSSTVMIDTTISIMSSVAIDGKLGKGRVTISSNKGVNLFYLPKRSINSLILQNINVRYNYVASSNNYCVFFNIDSSNVAINIDNVNFRNSNIAFQATGDSVSFNVHNLVCDSVSRVFNQDKTKGAWKSLVLNDCEFISNITYCIYGGEDKRTKLTKLDNCKIYNALCVLSGNSDSIVVSNSLFTNSKGTLFQVGGDNSTVNLKFTNSRFLNNTGQRILNCYLDSASVEIEGCEINGSIVSLTRQRYTSHYSKVRFVNNVVAENTTGITVNASHTEIFDNVFKGIKLSTKSNSSLGFGYRDIGSDTLIIKNNRFGIDKNDTLPNEKGGVLLSSNYFDVGIGFKGIPQIAIENNLFYGNGGNAIQVDSMRLNPYISQNTFLETQNLAISNIREVSIPKIESITQDGDYVYISGKTDSTATIELFLTSDKAQTAEKYLEKVQTNENGEFAFKMAKSDLGNLEKYCFTATAIYPCRITSTLSDVACVTNCTEVTTDLTESIRVGESYSFAPVFENKIFTEPGTFEYQKIVERPSGCDSIVNLKLTVNDLLTAYYVKTDGTGDGSSWKEAMGPKDFLSVLPIAKDGTTFYVAEGEYDFYTITNGKYAGVQESYSTKDGNRVNIIGGYPANVGGDEKSEPELYKTIFTSTYSSDTRREAYIALGGGGSLRNLYFQNIGVHTYRKALIDSCNFDNDLLSYSSDNFRQNCIRSDNFQGMLTVRNCTFKGQYYRVMYPFKTDSVMIENNTFTNTYCNVTGGSVISFAGCDHIRICNNTFVNAYGYEGAIAIQSNKDSDTVYVCNNTIVSSSKVENVVYDSNVNFSGNIVVNTDVNLSPSDKVKYNLTTESISTGETNKTITDEELSAVLNGEVNDGIFTPTLANNGGYAPTVKLLTDVLPDGTSIRFPLSETIVTEDQRGVKRYAMTSPGAYEKQDTVRVNITYAICAEGTCDTLGFAISGEEAGVGEHTYTRLVSGPSADTLYTLNVTVVPANCDINLKSLAYYVKTKAEGNGDGSSWENAMGPLDFASVLPVAREGATFYVAEGSYIPTSPVSSLIRRYLNQTYFGYQIRSSVNIKGGYPADASGNIAANPTLYKAKFHWGEFLFEIHDAKLVTFDGIAFDSSYYHGAIVARESNIKITNCEFAYNNSLYDRHRPSCILTDNNCEVSIENTSFYKNRGVIFAFDGMDYNTLSTVGSEKKIRVNQCSFYENEDYDDLGGIIGICSSKFDAEFTNSTFYDNYTKFNTDVRGLFCLSSECSLNVKNCTFKNNLYYSGNVENASLCEIK